MYTAPILITLGLLGAIFAIYWIGIAVIRTVERKQREKRAAPERRPKAAV